MNKGGFFITTGETEAVNPRRRTYSPNPLNIKRKADKRSLNYKKYLVREGSVVYLINSNLQ
ncbi:hypothetical protein COT98_03910 [Candidatus Falkowbacteria bacterium CG10_big_fil_rev_8_21_14_0_10_39_9]|uniref:Uncharacterized protein n=1 Tax=Candidatus Falkowbacteria bacterium CG10_big_fil_rev_8_21_14_0_10_39_9 TaxID=1974566 RepID=A0A2M6WNK7_9BACT|nr:MAG: hypothetical protein COT98_03910 [Candidatus Falkowbacteria bacterium CG10_big_fil_rev_8_21_14_0_10_39_9]